jgi:hypothetical protein
MLEKIRAITKRFQRLGSMPRSYHGSTTRYVIGRTGFAVRQFLRGLRKPKGDTALTEHLSMYQRAVDAREWENVRELARKIADTAEKQRNPELMAEMASALRRLHEHERSADLIVAAHRIRQG